MLEAQKEEAMLLFVCFFLFVCLQGSLRQHNTCNYGSFLDLRQRMTLTLICWSL